MSALESSESPVAREPWVAAILSFFFLGLGQAYNGQRKKAFLFYLSQFGLGALLFGLMRMFHEPIPRDKEQLSPTSPAFLIVMALGLLVWVRGIVDAYRTAQRINTGAVEARGSPGKSAVTFFITAIILIPVVVILLIIVAVVAGLVSHGAR